MNPRIDKAIRLSANCLMPAYKATSVYEEDSRDPTVTQIRLSNKGIKYGLSSNFAPAIERASKRLMPVLEHYPEEALKRKLIDAVLKCHDEAVYLENAHAYFVVELRGVISELSRGALWLVITAVRGIELGRDSFKIAGIEFKWLSESEFLLWGQRMSTGQLDPPPFSGVQSFWVQQHAALRNHAVAACETTSADYDQAVHKTLGQLSEIIDLLRYGQLYLNMGGPPAELGIGQYVHLVGYSNQTVAIRIDGPGLQSSLSVAGSAGASPNAAKLCPGWYELEMLIGKPHANRSEMESRVVTALNWLGQAALTDSNAVRVVCYVTAIEAMLLLPSESAGKRSKLKTRIPKLVPPPHCRAYESEDVDRVYKMRSEAVHGGSISLTSEEERLAFHVLVHCLHAFVCDPKIVALTSLEDVLNALGISFKAIPEDFQI